MTEATAKTTLSERQQARVAAIRVAREILQNASGGGAFTRQATALPKHRSVTDLVDIGRWIETGQHPLDQTTEVEAAAPQS